MNIREIFAANLRTFRLAKGLSQEEFASRVDIHRTYVSALERSLYSATIDMLDKFAKVLGVEAADLLDAETAKRAPAPEPIRPARKKAASSDPS